MSSSRLSVVFSERMVGDPWRAAAPGPQKPRHVASALSESGLPIRWVVPEPATRADLYRAHDRRFVDEVLDCQRPSAFGTLSEDLAQSLPYTSGAVYSSALSALHEGVSASLTCGFHHAQYDHARSYCTFNGLIVACLRLLTEKRVERILILDCDYHYGDGTEALIQHHRLAHQIKNESFGLHYRQRPDATRYLQALANLETLLGDFRPDLILYQAGVDVHVDDPLGGLLTTSEIVTRDQLVFSYAQRSGIPITWNLAGGYQMDMDGAYSKMVALHLNTFRVAAQVFCVTELPGS